MVTFLVCVGIASLLWVVRALNRNYKYSLHIPVKFENLPANKIIVGDLPEKLDVEIKTSGLKLLFISSKKFNVPLSIDFFSLKNNYKSQAYSIGVNNLNLKTILNFDVDVLKIKPDTLFFSSDKGKTKIVPLKANLSVQCVDGYDVVSKPVLNPSYITISGDSADISKIDTIYTQRLHLKDIHENYASPVRLIKPSSNISFNLKNAHLSFEVDKMTEAKIKIPITVTNMSSKQKIKLIPDYVNVTYLVSMRNYDQVSEQVFNAHVDFKYIQKKDKKIKVQLSSFPSEVKIKNISPAYVSYLIYKP